MFSKEIDLDANMLKRKGTETFILALVDAVVMLGLLISKRLSENQYTKSLTTISCILFGMLLFFSVRYFYYYKTGKYEVIEGVCIDVNGNLLSKTFQNNCVVIIKSKDNNIYRFHAQYKRMFYVIGKRIKVIVPKGVRSRSKEGHIYLDEVLIKKSYDSGL